MLGRFLRNTGSAVDPTVISKRYKLEAEARRKRVKIRCARDKRLNGWLVFFRLPSEIGLGDTTARMRRLAARKKLAIEKPLADLLHICGCQPQDAISKLNEDHPYPSQQKQISKTQ